MVSDWITMHPSYGNKFNQGGVKSGGLSVFSKPLTSSFMSRELHNETIDMYLAAARQNHTSKILLHCVHNSKKYLQYKE